jgi:ferredoxin-NADP reductase/ferredoxin
MLGDLTFSSLMYDIGVILVAVITLQTLLFFYSSVRSSLYARTHQKYSLQTLQIKVLAETRQGELERKKASSTWSGLRKFRVSRIFKEAKDIKSFYLVPHDGKSFPSFHPGQYLTFNLRITDREKPLVRCYSLSGSPFHKEHYKVSIKRLDPPRDMLQASPGVSSNFFHKELTEDDIVDVKAPAGNFTLDLSKHTPVVLIGGGIGVTPMLSMLEGIYGSDSRRETWLFYGIKNGDEYIMPERLRELAADHENIHIQICYSNPRDQTDILGSNYDHNGRVTLELLQNTLKSNNYEFYICGPGPMMESLTSGLKEWGVPDQDVNFEAFGPASVKKTSSASRHPELTQENNVTVEFSKSSKIIPWDGSCSSILELAENNDVVIDSGCRAGSCGTCLTALKGGEVNYVEEPGTLPEASSCLACISIPKTNLILDA